MKKYRRLPAALVVACLALGMVAAPSALAAGKAQSSAKRVTVKSVNTKLNSTRKSLAKTTKSLGQLSARLKKGENSIALLLGAAPQLIDGLTKLSDAVQNQIAPGLLQLKAALEGDVTKALKETIPNAIKEVATSQEYGITRVVLGPGGAGGPLPFTLGSADIPDDGNTVTAQGELPIPVGPTAALGQVPGGTLLTLRSAIRSGESDGNATGDPAGYVGGLLTMKCGAGLPANAGNCDLDPGAGVTPVPPGTVVCVVGPAASQTINLPDGSTTTQGIVTIQEAADRTDQDEPTNALSTSTVNPLAGAADNPAPPLNNNAADGCNLGPTTGDTYVVTVQTQFLDIPTSKSPKATD